MITGAVKCVWQYSFCIVMLSGGLESNICYDSKAVNEMVMISFGRLVHFCIVDLQFDIFLASFCLGHSSVHACLSGRQYHFPNVHIQSDLTSCSFSIRKT
jgi:hypothetical protein